MACSVFISYSTVDVQKAIELKQYLERDPKTKFQVFLAETSVSVGDNLPTTITNAIKGCDFFLVLWSESAATSKWVPQEIGQAVNAGKPIYPIVLEEGSTLPGFISGLKYLPAYKGEDAVRRWVAEELSDKGKWVETTKLIGFLVLAAAVAWVLFKVSAD